MTSTNKVPHSQPKPVLSEDLNKQKIIKPTGKDQGTSDYEATYKSSERDRDEHTAEENDFRR